MESVERPHRNRKWIERPRKDRRGKLDQSDTPDEGPRALTMRPAKTARMQARPYFVFKQATGDQGFAPQAGVRDAILCEDLRQGHRGIDVDQRPSRSARSSDRISSRRATGCRGGAPLAGNAGGVTQPRRTASARRASAGVALRPAAGGTSSATTRSRSVTRTVSPDDAARTYSLSWFFRALMPTILISAKVATRSHLCKPLDPNPSG